MIIVLFIAQNVFADDPRKEKPHWWIEIWGDLGYQRTNAWYEVQRNFDISVVSTKIGYRFYLFDNMYVDPYFKTDLKYDFGGKGQNRFFWNNNIQFAPGIRIRLEFKRPYEPDKQYGLRFNYANIDAFLDSISIVFIHQRQSVPENIPRKDVRSGMNSWISASNNLKLTSGGLWGSLWFEMWSDLSYRSTNFYLDGKDNFLILTLSPKVGLRLAKGGLALEPYFRLDFVHDMFDQDWNREAWSNNVKYGPGIRLSVGGVMQRNETSIYLYFESVHIDYSARAGWKAIGLSNYDYRAGVNVWFPIGATKGIR